MNDVFVNKNRDITIDAYRFIAFFFVILVHVDPPDFIVQLTYFNVPMMVFVSGVCTSSVLKTSYFEYVWHRIKRIIIPMYLFIVPCYLLPLYLAQCFGIIRAGLTYENILGCFIFYQQGMGYIWIFKVFLLIGLVAPFIAKLNKKIQSDIIYFLIVVLIVIIQHFLCLFTKGLEHLTFAYVILDNYIVYLTGYLPFFMLGVRLKSLAGRKLRNWATIMVVIFGGALCIYIYYHSFSINITGLKYPPQSYFIIYGCMVSVVLWGCKMLLRYVAKLNVCIFIGQNTNWIYLWHMPFVLLCNSFLDSWVLKLSIIWICALFMFVFQYKLVVKSQSRFCRKYLVG